jgi:hypothetical protein
LKVPPARSEGNAFELELPQHWKDESVRLWRLRHGNVRVIAKQFGVDPEHSAADYLPFGREATGATSSTRCSAAQQPRGRCHPSAAAGDVTFRAGT